VVTQPTIELVLVRKRQNTTLELTANILLVPEHLVVVVTLGAVRTLTLSTPVSTVVVRHFILLIVIEVIRRPHLF
jgi:hypothetical protein